MDLAGFFRRRFTGHRRKAKPHPPRQGLPGLTTRHASRLESLECRALLTTFYVDNNLLLTADRDASGGLSPGDQVTFGNGQSYQQADLTYDAAPADGDVGTAFNSIAQALASPLVQAGDTIEIAGGTYTESVTIDKSLTLQGEGNVVLQSPTTGGTVATMTVDSPGSVTLDNLDFTSTAYALGLVDNGGDTLNLIDISGRDGFNIDGVTNLNISRTASTPQRVNIGPDIVAYVAGYVTDNLPYPSLPILPSPAPPPWDGKTGVITFQDQDSTETELVFQAANLSVSTGSGNDVFSVIPLPQTNITVDGGAPAPPTLPGDSLTVVGGNASGLSLTSDATGYSGTWSEPGDQPVHFSHFESLGPGDFFEEAGGFSATEGAAYNGTVLQFNDSTPNVPLSDYSVTIDWGDGETSAGSVVPGGPYATLAVAGSHTYSHVGLFTISVAVSRPGTFNTALTGTAGVSEPPLVGTGVTLSATQGEAIGATTSGAAAGAVVATFTDANTSNDDFTASIKWGDGDWTTGTVTPVAGAAGEWAVSGSHTYTAAGSYTITVYVDGDWMSPASITSQANVAPATLTALTATAETLTGSVGVTLGSSSGALVASFEQDSTANENYQATIDWGDGTTSAGTVFQVFDVLPPLVDRAFWQVDGSHAYQAPGTYSIVVTLSANGSQVATVTSTAVITGSNVITSTPNEQFVANVYHDLLGRTIEAAGMGYWSGQLDAGMSRSRFVADIERSGEYLKDEITSLYKYYLQRTPEPAALDADANLLAGGFTDEQLAMTLVSSQEYFALHGRTNDGFLSALFEDALQRPIDAAAKAALEQDLAAGASRAQVAFIVFSSHEYHADLVNDFYLELLDRAADAAGGAYWANRLDGGMTDEQVLANLAVSEEYFGKRAS